VFLADLGFALWVLVFRLFVGFCGFSLLFFFFFLLACVWFLLYTSCMLRGFLRFFILFSFFYMYIYCLPIKKSLMFNFIHKKSGMFNFIASNMHCSDES
jgi:hypothetical protein